MDKRIVSQRSGHFRVSVLTIISCLAVGAACTEESTTKPDFAPDSWAVNVGGPAYEAVDGTFFAADEAAIGGETGSIEIVKGSQDDSLYTGFREGDIAIEQALANGRYDVTLHFAEPHESATVERLFDVLIEDRLAIDDLDIMGWRDGKIHSGLSITVPGVVVDDRRLNITFNASSGKPLLSAVLARPLVESESEWQIFWQDEFDDGFNTDLWNVDLWPARVVNDEDQAYTDRPENLRVENGHLIIEARKESYGNAKYTSARIHSRGSGDVFYGRIEVRAKLPYGQGSWPAIWMLPSDPFRYATKCEDGDTWQGNADCNAWPNSGEIDIMEHVGYQMGHIHGTVHNEAYYWAKWEQRKGRILFDNVDEAFHNYVVEWSPQRIDMYVDDVLYFTYINEGEGWRSWPYDHPFHLILNVAVGGMWGRAGGPIDDEIFPQKMMVDYVRVYTRAEDD